MRDRDGIDSPGSFCFLGDDTMVPDEVSASEGEKGMQCDLVRLRRVGSKLQLPPQL